jgi:tRNA/tmRNA/rRNA uracil-C5-methylase (TrmA/RlmC/RlmD family)
MEDKSLNFVVFGKKKFSDILKEIYDNQQKKDTQISSLIGELKTLIGDIGDATMIVPLIRDYLEMGVKNDEQLVKLAQIIQRIASTSDSGVKGNEWGMSEEEKTQLLNLAEDIKNKGEENK